MWRRRRRKCVCVNLERSRHCMMQIIFITSVMRASDIWKKSLFQSWSKDQVHLRGNISSSGRHLLGLRREVRTRLQTSVKKPEDEYRKELIEPSSNKSRAPSVRLSTRSSPATIAAGKMSVKLRGTRIFRQHFFNTKLTYLHTQWL